MNLIPRKLATLAIAAVVILGAVISFQAGQSTGVHSQQATIHEKDETIKKQGGQLSDQLTRLQRANKARQTEADAVKTVVAQNKKLADAIAVLSENAFAKCRANRNAFNNLMLANSNDAFAALIVAAFNPKPVNSPPGPSPIQAEALVRYFKASSDYNAAIRAPDVCKSIP